MKKTIPIKGVTLVEVAVASAILVLAMGLLWNGVKFLQQTLSQQMRLERMNQVLLLTQEISQAVRQAKRISSLGPDHLELEVYDHASYNPVDPRLYENLKRVRYVFSSDENASSLRREVFSSTTSAKPENSHVFLKNADLDPPTSTQPFFFASYLVGNSTVGVRIEIAIHPPYSKVRWVPVKNEVYVQAE